MSKISLFTELTTGNVADGDLVPVVDITASATKKVLASSMYAYYLSKLEAESTPRLLPASAGSSGEFLQHDGAYGTPPDTTYSVMASGNSYAIGLVPAGSATHNQEYLRKDGTFSPHYSLKSTPLTTSRPQLSISKSSGGTQTDGTFTFPSTEYMDIVITKEQHDTTSGADVVTFDFSATVSVDLTGHTTGSTFQFDITSDLSSFAIDNSSASMSPNYTAVALLHSKNHYPCVANLQTTTLELPNIDVGISGDGVYSVTFAGQLRYYIN